MLIMNVLMLVFYILSLEFCIKCSVSDVLHFVFSFFLLVQSHLTQYVRGEVSYNGHKLEEFVPQNTSTYISQHDLHIPQMTMRKTLEFAARCQGVGGRAGTFLYVRACLCVCISMYN